MRPALKTPVRVALVGAALVLAACARDAAAPGTEPLDDAEALRIGREIAGEVQDMTRSLDLGDLLTPSFPGLSLHPRPGFRCAVLEPFPPEDTDGDGVPNTLTITFALPACSFVHDRYTVEITGTVLITDPSEIDFGFQVEVDELQEKLIGSDGRFELRRLDGLVRVLRSAREFSVIDRTTATRESSDHSAAVLEKDWEVHFLADEGETIDGWRHLPSGTLTVNGSTIRTRGDHVHSLQIATDATAPLHFDATCEADQKFDAGVLVITKARGEERVTITVTFTGCGEEPIIEVQRSPGA
jgi:hypothetical protein